MAGGPTHPERTVQHIANYAPAIASCDRKVRRRPVRAKTKEACVAGCVSIRLQPDSTQEEASQEKPPSLRRLSGLSPPFSQEKLRPMPCGWPSSFT